MRKTTWRMIMATWSSIRLAPRASRLARSSLRVVAYRVTNVDILMGGAPGQSTVTNTRL